MFTEFEKDSLYYALVAINDAMFEDEEGKADCNIRDFVLNFLEITDLDFKDAKLKIEATLNKLCK